MFRSIYILIIFSLVLAACGGNVATVPATETPVASTPSPLPTTATTDALTFTVTPTSTPIPPTVDLAKLPTRTPQPPAVCPAANDQARIPLAGVFKNKKAVYYDARQAVLDFLNAGGNPQMAIDKLAENSVTARQMDITHDGIKEFFLPSGYYTIFGCKDGQYVTLLDIPPTENTEMAAVLLVIQDLNLNGVPELLIGQAQYSDRATYRLLEWDGSQLASLTPVEFSEKGVKVYIDDQVIYTIGQSNARKGALVGNYEVLDTDSNGLLDVVIRAGVYQEPTSSSDLEDTIVLMWNGTSYVVGEVSKEFTPTPEPTSTPLPFSATCSNKVPSLRYTPPSDPSYKALIQAITDFLNAGGQPELLKSYYKTTIQDLNNDSALEILVIKSLIAGIYLFSCQNGKYAYTEVYAGFGGGNSINILSLTDNNKNGLPEIFMKEIGCFNNRCGALSVVEWDGEKFAQIIKDTAWNGEVVSYATMHEPANAYLKDLDNDGIKELVWIGELPPSWHGDHWADYPQRLATHVFKWDGTNYAAQPVEYAPPEYRFQAVHDGDNYAKGGAYEKALKSYQLAIESESLEWWTEERRDYIIGPYGYGPCAETGASCPPPAPDPNERPILSAYSAFRIMLVHLLTNNPSEAEKTYQELLSTYSGTPASPILNMAAAFWAEYQASQNISQACQKAVISIKDQKEVLGILSGKGSFQSFNYEYSPEEVCPFK